MNEYKHSPGPWFISEDGPRWDAFRTIYALVPGTKNKKYIGRVYVAGWNAKPDEERIANAKVIAAAPMLLEALDDLYQHIVDTNPNIIVECPQLFAKVSSTLFSAKGNQGK